MNDDMASRLKRAREKRGYKSARAAAAAIGVKYPTYSEHERFGKIPRDSLVRYAKFFGVSVDWLLYGKGGTAPLKSAAMAKLTIPLRQIPLFKLNELTIFSQMRNNGLLAEASEYIAVPNDTPPTAFAVTLTDKSMTQPVGISLDPGTVAIVDPASTPEPGDLVFAVSKEFKEALVRHFGRAIQAGITQVVLTPWNTAFETVTFVPDDDSWIIGRVRSAMIYF